MALQAPVTAKLKNSGPAAANLLSPTSHVGLRQPSDRYIYQDWIPLEKQPDKYFCPVCAAPKRRFRVYEPPVNKNANATDTRKARKAELQRDEAVGKALPIAIAAGVTALAGLYFYLNSAF